MPKKPPTQPSAKPQSANSSTTTVVDLKTQQRLLDIYAAAFADVLSSDHFTDTLQEIKQALFNRDFAVAFGRTEFLEAYAARWSPTRTLGYSAILKRLEGYFRKVIQVEADDNNLSKKPELGGSHPSADHLRMLCIGGCAAEHVAFANLIHSSSFNGTLTLLDSAPWSSISNKLQNHLTNPPVLSPFASVAAQTSNHAFLHASRLSLRVEQQDILSLSKDDLARHTGKSCIIVTLLFTLNELYTDGGIGKTTRFLGFLGEVLQPDSLLLVVDSPGSYSEAALGKEKKRYPMHWLLDHTLIEKSPPGVLWEKLESQESVWFRLSDGLSYPIALENMRYQLHLYRLTNGGSSNK